MISERYRSDYDGEFVVLETRITANAFKQTREWIPNTVRNKQISDRAAIIGSDIDRKLFEWRRLDRHKGGLLAKKKLQTYGVAELGNEMKFDFLYLGDEKTAGIIDDSKEIPSIIFTSASICINHPKKFHLVPYLPNLDKFALPIYLAAFDGHKEIFLIGYSNAMPMATTAWEKDIKQIFNTYNNTQFYIVGRGDYPNSWRECLNVQDMQYRKFITYCDV